MAEVADTSDYDTRFDRAQTADGAKARYVEDDDYGEAQLEADLERIHTGGEYPDGDPIDEAPLFEGQTVYV